MFNLFRSSCFARPKKDHWDRRICSRCLRRSNSAMPKNQSSGECRRRVWCRRRGQESSGHRGRTY
jgi:hypothetical protein